MTPDSKEKIVSAVLADPVVKATVEHHGVKTDKTVEMPESPTVPVAALGEHAIIPGQVGEKTVDKPNVMISRTGQAVAAPTTTEEEDRATVGQRRINLIWETTQSLVAITVTASTLFVAGKLALNDKGDTAAFLLLSNVFFLVLGTYFNRTNHVKIGGVGKNESGR